MPTEEEREELRAAHRKELKELRGRIQAIKNAVPKGDKKRKKQATEEIAQLESDIAARHAAELTKLEESTREDANAASASACASAEPQESTGQEADDYTEAASTSAAEGSGEKLSKAQRRRLKKGQEARERAERFEEAEKAAVNSDRNVEMRSLTALLESLSLKVHQVEADGNCLYYALAYQLHHRQNEGEMKALRRQAADFMLAHRDDFEAFVSEADLQQNEDSQSEDTFQRYCRQVADTSMWGGQLEIQALARALDRKVMIYQANTNAVTIGSDGSQAPLHLVYHKHDLGTGEHYNAAVPMDS